MDEVDEILYAVYEQGLVDEHGEIKDGESIYPDKAMQPSEAKAKIQRLILTARYRELVDLGKLYNGSKVKYFDHYEERHKYLTKQLEKGSDV